MTIVRFSLVVTVVTKAQNEHFLPHLAPFQAVEGANCSGAFFKADLPSLEHNSAICQGTREEEKESEYSPPRNDGQIGLTIAPVHVDIRGATSVFSDELILGRCRGGGGVG